MLLFFFLGQDKGRPLPKFGEWDVNDPASAEGFTVIFNKARDEKKTGGKPESPPKADHHVKPGVDPGKPQPVTIVDFSPDLVLFFRKNGFAAFKPHQRNLDEVLPV
ncbi:Pathogenic type III effector avirulence factor Avr cleavage site [Corchorus olitorius]|uniref:Pathogenic type III effector avirulence factor Avr cleavage site n=1 Tax=Corchorus olitorius TaxID=93759 RepID=A0A1R3KB15_9ROSI|nr:Pathogenic type III effector avirulence factor Avr cleavage site [Corchorus olitorius]